MKPREVAFKKQISNFSENLEGGQSAFSYLQNALGGNSKEQIKLTPQAMQALDDIDMK